MFSEQLEMMRVVTAFFDQFYIQRRFGVSYIFTIVSFCVCLSFLMNDRHWTIRGAICKLLDAVMTWLVCVLLDSVLYRMVGHPRLELYVALPLLTFIHMPIMNRWDWNSRLVLGAIFYSTFCLTYNISADGPNWLRSEGLLPPMSGAADATALISVIMPLLTVLYLKRLSIVGMRHRHRAATLLVLVVSVLAQVFLLIRPDYSEVILMRLAAEVILWITELLSYYMLYAVTQEYNRSLELQAMKLREDTERILTNFSGANYEELRKLRHDIRNHLAYIGALLENQKYDEAHKYFTSLSEDVAIPLGYTDSGNDAVNAIVNFERLRAAAQGVALTLRLSVPEKLPLPDSELCSLLTNLLDNAIEASAEVEAAERRVELTMIRRGSHLLIDVNNPISSAIPPEERLRLNTTKKDRDIHGFGTKIICSIVEKHSGVCRFDSRDGRFLASVMLELEDTA